MLVTIYRDISFDSLGSVHVFRCGVYATVAPSTSWLLYQYTLQPPLEITVQPWYPIWTIWTIYCDQHCSRGIHDGKNFPYTVLYAGFNIVTLTHSLGERYLQGPSHGHLSYILRDCKWRFATSFQIMLRELQKIFMGGIESTIWSNIAVRVDLPSFNGG